MYYATGIRMRDGCEASQKYCDIEAIYVDGIGADAFYTPRSLHWYLKKNVNAIRVMAGDEPLPVISVDERAVRSAPDDAGIDYLLSLPRL